ncbi:MAG: LPS export ABC transporter permease LptG [Gammaproteobacteria bacterium]|nr:LPS export ABC transporter permease LptG [Gammaproteobacteria bacterium]
MILDRYIARAVIAGSLMVLLLITSVDAVFALINELSSVGKQDYDLTHAALYIVYTIPRRMHDYFASSVLIGSLLSLGAMAANSELIVMRSAGVSPKRIIRSVLQVGLLLAVMMAVIGEWLAPVGDRRAEELRSTALEKRVSLTGANGLWVKDGGRYINVRTVLPDLHLRGVTIYEFDGLVLRFSLSAVSAYYETDHWLLKGLRYSYFNEDRVEIKRLKQQQWPYLINVDLFNVLSVQPESMSARELYNYIEYLRNNELDASRYELAFWSSLLAPLSALVMLLLAMPFVFGSLRSSGAGQKILLGTLIGVGYFLLARLFGHLGLVYGLSPFISAVLPLLLFLGAGVYLLRRVL